MNWNEYFYYDESSPSCLRWKTDRRSGRGFGHIHTPAHSVAGSKNKEGYWQIKLGNKNYQAHRIVWELLCGEIPEDYEINHKNRDRALNLIDNLEPVTKQHNLENKSMYSSNKTGVTGVRQVQRVISGGVYNSFVAHWREGGSQKEKWFSCEKYGHEQAFQLACDYRNKMIQDLNAQGAGYSDTHGK